MRRDAQLPWLLTIIALSFVLILSSTGTAALVASVLVLGCAVLLTARLWADLLHGAHSEAAGCPKPAHFTLQQEEALTRALTGEGADSYPSLLRAIILLHNDEQALPHLSLSLAACALRILDSMQKNLAELFGEGADLYRRFRAAESREALLETATGVFEALAGALGQAQATTPPALSEKMLLFIEQNYHREITLADLAAHLRLSRNYASTLFHDAVGTSFKEYVGKRRFIHACALMENDPQIKIRDVAEQVGASPAILGRLFLRYSGVSPQEYKRRQA